MKGDSSGGIGRIQQTLRDEVTQLEVGQCTHPWRGDGLHLILVHCVVGRVVVGIAGVVDLKRVFIRTGLRWRTIGRLGQRYSVYSPRANPPWEGAFFLPRLAIAIIELLVQISWIST